AYYKNEMDSIVSVDISREEELKILLLEQKAETFFIQKKFDEAVKTIQKILDTVQCDKSDRGWYLQRMAYYQYFSSKIESQKLQRSAFEYNFELLKPKEGVTYKKIENINLNRMQNIIKNVQKFKTFEELMLE